MIQTKTMFTELTLFEYVKSKAEKWLEERNA